VTFQTKLRRFSREIRDESRNVEEIPAVELNVERIYREKKIGERQA
jgi:hypothetical protein